MNSPFVHVQCEYVYQHLTPGWPERGGYGYLPVSFQDSFLQKEVHEWQRALAVILIHRTIVTAVPLHNSITQAMLQALNELIPEKSWGILQTFNVPWCSKSPVRVALHTRWNGTIICPICIGNDIDNPVGQALLGDSVTPVRTTVTKKVLVGSLKASSSCSVDPQGPHWARGVAVK